MWKLTTLLVGIELLGAGIAFGADPPRFDEVDTDQDGKISKNEAAARVPMLNFARADKNTDGFLSHTEYVAAMKEVAFIRPCPKGRLDV
jgi:hypothetical protein